MPSSLRAGFRVESLHTADDYRRAAALYTRVFGYTGSDFGLNANLLSALRKSGGSTVGAFDEADELIGFAYGFAATDAQGAHFHHSQAAAVDGRFQGCGVGRRLKELQRDVALSWGQTRMRWTFDPLLTRNAHFNFISLGAEGIRYEPDFYDRPGSDRLVVDWDLARTVDPYAAYRTRSAPIELAGRVGETADAGAGGLWIAVPRAAATDLGADDPTRQRVRSALSGALEGRVLVSCMPVDDETSAYLAVPREEHR